MYFWLFPSLGVFVCFFVVFFFCEGPEEMSVYLYITDDGRYVLRIRLKDFPRQANLDK